MTKSMEIKSIVLNNKQNIILNDDDTITISIILGNKTLYTMEIPYPSCGYGDGSLFLSSSEKFLLFSYYSGESEEAYMLFRIYNSYLEFVYASEILCGEGASYLFSENDLFLFQALPESVGPWYCEDAQTDENGNFFFPFCQINILDIQNKTVANHTIRVFPSNHWDNNMAEKEPPHLLEIIDTHTLCIAMPWGEEKIPLPLEKLIIFNPR